MTEKISVLIITRNRAKILKECLKSLVKQTRQPDEIIAVDNASDDQTKQIILSFKDKLPIRYVEEKHIGIPYARNRGIKQASGTLLLMLDDDCVADKFWVERMVDAHRKYPKVWAIQGRTYSLPKNRIYSILAEFHGFLYYQNSAVNQNLKIEQFFSRDFIHDVEIQTCDTKNFSIKTCYLKKYKLLFDNNFYRGSDTDLGKQILQKNGTIILCSTIQMYHFGRSTLTAFLEQYWHIGRTAARIAHKWRTPPLIPNTLSLRMIFPIFIFCKFLNQWRNLPMLTLILFLDRLYRLNGYFYEKSVLSLKK